MKAIIFSCSLFLFLFPILLHAQPGFGDDVDDVPIDGGISVLVAAGVGYGMKKIKSGKDSRNHNK
jgi:hypothetical protein